MAYYGTNSVLAQAHWDASQSSNSYFDLKQSFGCSSVTKIANGEFIWIIGDDDSITDKANEVVERSLKNDLYLCSP